MARESTPMSRQLNVLSFSVKTFGSLFIKSQTKEVSMYLIWFHQCIEGLCT